MRFRLLDPWAATVRCTRARDLPARDAFGTSGSVAHAAGVPAMTLGVALAPSLNRCPTAQPYPAGPTLGWARRRSDSSSANLSRQASMALRSSSAPSLTARSCSAEPRCGLREGHERRLLRQASDAGHLRERRVVRRLLG